MSRIILITGTRKGIGKELSEYYLGKGFTVIGCSRQEKSIEHPNYHHYNTDVSDEKGVVAMVSDIRKKFKRIDYLLNNAGVASMNHLILTPLETARRVFDTNFFGTFLCLREVSKLMMKQKFGRIVNYSTVAVPLVLEGEAIYSASKMAVEQLTKIAAKELADFNITINAIGPTPVKTDLIKNVPENKIQDLLNRQAIKRFGEFDDLKNVIDFFLDDKSDFITGQVIYLGGVN
ncbi:MAG: oxidoreductase [Spirochaetes bacterium GWD1_27_9]|nr:MAG: oxidoreductase [Spirochaetes bacterium GWB1_27_13]OHD35574.1 MAG: oxidoreductase [Spirochaetes bacterium GWD1_27_9]